MYRAHCYFTVGWAGRNDIPDNRQDFLSCKHFVEWPALLSMKYRGSTGYSLNINKPARARPVRGCSGPATRNDIVDFSSSTMAFNVAKIASAHIVGEIVTCGRAFPNSWNSQCLQLAKCTNFS